MDNGNAPAGNDGDHNNGIYQFNQSSNHYKTPKIYDFPIFAVAHSKSQNSILNRVIEMLSALLCIVGEPTVTGGLPSQKASDVEIEYRLFDPRRSSIKTRKK